MVERSGSLERSSRAGWRFFAVSDVSACSLAAGFGASLGLLSWAAAPNATTNPSMAPNPDLNAIGSSAC
jgi:hypothetical protein